MSSLDFYTYQLMLKPGQTNQLHTYLDLYQESLAEVHAKDESVSFTFVIKQKLKAKIYVHQQNAF